MGVLSLATLLVQETKEQLYKTALGIATAVGLPVTSWQEGDPTRSLYHLESEVLAKLEEVVVGYIESGFLDLAKENGWFEICAKQYYNVDVPGATYAETDVVLTNNGARFFGELEPGDLAFRNTVTGKTFTSSTGGTLAAGPGTTLTVHVIADEPGSDSTSGAGELELVTGLLGVTATNATAAIGIDKQDKATSIQQCLDKLDSLSDEGPPGIYRFVALSRDLTGTAAITRVRAYPDSDTGDMTLYLAGPSGGVAEADRALVEAAILQWATPLCITPTVLSAANVIVNVTYELWVYKSVNKTVDEVKADVLAALEAMILRRPIGGDVIPPADGGSLYLSMIESTIRGVYDLSLTAGLGIFRAVVTAPAVDVALAKGQVAVLGAVAGTIHLVLDP